jgi:squalene synthase HpnC
LTSEQELAAADKYCRHLASRHYENFSVASRMLPPETRLHLARIYAFCRSTDDFGDETLEGPAVGRSPEEGRALSRLKDWRGQVQACLERGDESTHPVLIALSRTCNHFALPSQPFLDLIEANVQDQTVTTYETWEDLRRYCVLSAAPVGRMVLGVFGVQDSRAERLSDSVCIGLQLANFAQDVRVDSSKGRTYLLQSDLRAGDTPSATQRMCDRAAGLLQAGVELEQMVPFRLRVQLSLYRLGGLAIVSAIQEMDFATEERRPQVSRWVKVRLIPQALRQSSRRTQHVLAKA